MTLTDEQFESILAGTEPEPPALGPDDRARLDEARAVRERLRKAFEPVTAGAPLGERIGAALRRQPEPTDAQSRGQYRNRRPRVVRLVKWLAPLAAAAAVLIVLAVLDFGAEPAAAGPAELTRIHTDNLAAAGQFLAAGDADQIAEHFQKHMGFTPKICPHDGHTALIGCCVAEFQGRKAATYLLTAGGRKISVVITDETPDAMGLTCKCGCGMAECTCFHTGQCDGRNIVSVRIAGRSYTAVGAAPPEQLKDILSHLRT